MSDGKQTITPPRFRNDPLIRLVAINGAAGVCIAMLVMGGIFWANIGNLRVLVSKAEDPVLPVLMLAFALVITLGSVVIGSAIMLLGRQEHRGNPPGGKLLQALTADFQDADAYAPVRSGGTRKTD